MSTQETTIYSSEKWSNWFEQLANQDYVFVDDFIPDQLYQQVQSYFQQLLDESEFSKAAIGTNQQRQIESSVRGYFIYWLDKQSDDEIINLFDLFDETLMNLRQQLFLSISDYEFHFALYPPQTRYEKHIDQFHGKKNRVLSMLIYLNKDWKLGDGGKLKIYGPGANTTLIEPIAKRMVMFKSDTVEHEVLLTQTSRKSITGWLLHQPATIGKFI
jgi:SM-20-related protein